MAQNKEFVYKIKVVNESGQVVDSTAASFADLSSSVKSLEGELEKSKFGSDKWNQLNEGITKNKTALQDATKKSEAFALSQQSLGERLSAIPGPVGQVAQGVKGLGTAFKALIANPIGAVLAAIAAVFVGLYKAINSTEEGAFKFKEALAALSGILDPVIKLAGELGKVLIDGIVAGIEAVQKALDFLGFDSIAKASEDAQKLAKSINQVEEAEGDLNVARAQQNKALAETREIISDTNVSLKERQAALAKVKKSEEDLAAKETALSKQKLKNIQEEINLKGKSTELLDAEEQALISLANTEQNQAAIRRKNIKAEQSLVREDEAKKKEAADKAKQRAEDEKKRLEDIRKFTQDINLASIKDDDARAKKEVDIQKEALLKQLDDLKITGEKKVQLQAQIAQNAADKIAKIDADAAEKKRLEDEKIAKEAEQKEKDAFAKRQEAQATEVSLVQTELQTQLALFNKYFSDRADLANENREDELEIAGDKAQKEFEINRLSFEDQLILIDSSIERVKEELIKQRDIELSGKDLTESQKLAITQKYDKAITDTDAAGVQAREKIRDVERAQIQASRDLLAGGLNALSALAGENFELQQAVAYAQTIISTYQAAQAAYASQLSIPTPDAPVRASIAAGIAIAQGIARAVQISKQKPPETKTMKAADGMIVGQGSGQLDNIPVYVSNGESIVNARSTRMFKPLLSAINQVGGGRKFAAGGITGMSTQVSPQTSLLNNISQLSQNTPIKTYVVSTDVESMVALDRQTKSRSTL